MDNTALIEYAKASRIEINENSSFEIIFEKVTGQTYNNYLKEQEEAKKSRHKLNKNKYLKES